MPFCRSLPQKDSFGHRASHPVGRFRCNGIGATVDDARTRVRSLPLTSADCRDARKFEHVPNNGFATPPERASRTSVPCRFGLRKSRDARNPVPPTPSEPQCACTISVSSARLARTRARSRTRGIPPLRTWQSGRSDVTGHVPLLFDFSERRGAYLKRSTPTPRSPRIAGPALPAHDATLHPRTDATASAE